MKTCKTCKWWGVDFEEACDFVTNIQDNKKTILRIHSFADDDQGLNTELMTGPDFGCIHHKTKE